MSKIDYKLIADTTYDWEYFIDPNGTILYCSPSCERITGYTKEEYYLDPELIIRIVSPKDKILFESALGMKKKLKLINEIEFRVITKDGSVVWIENASKEIYDDGGNYLGIRGSSRDISKRKYAEEEVKRFFNLVRDMACIANVDGYFLKVNPEWEKVLGYSERELIETPFAEFIHPDDREATFKEVDKQLAGEKTIKFTNRYRAKDGSYKWLEWNTTPAVNNKYLFAVARDVTERKQAEKAMANSLKEKDILLKEIHHRVKNNFQIINSLLSLQAEMVTDGKTQEVFTASQNRIKSMSLIHELIYGSEMFSDINVRAYIYKLVEYLRTSFVINEAAIVITQDIEEIELQLDKLIPLGLIITEVISNSYNHAFHKMDKGEIIISLKRKKDDGYFLSIIDNGRGLPADFDLTNKRSLGIFLVQTLTRQLNGTFLFENGKSGTTTIITF